MGRRLVLLPLLGLLALGYADKCPKQRTSPGREILCYTTTTDVKLLEDSICRCTTLVHQGHDLKDLSTSDIEEFQKSLKEMNPILQFVLSVSDEDGSLKTSARIRQEAAARIVRVLNEVDGIELNVTAGTKERLVHFVQGLKTELVRKSKDKRILLVLPTRPDDLAKQFDLKALSKYVDLFVLPTHYLVDDEEAFRTFHPSRLMGLFDMLNTDSLVDLVSGLGAGKRKILVSLPASVYKFALTKNDDNAPRAAAKGKLPVQISRSEMCEAMNEGEWIVERDEDLTAPYAFKDDTWIAFEDKISAGIKGKYVLLRDLAGLGIHNVEKDSKSKCGNSLTEDVYHSFTDNKRKTREAVLTSLQEDLSQTQSPYSGHVKSSEYRIVRVVDTDGHIHAMRENTQTEFSCPRQGYFVHPKSCNRFYRCVKFNQGVDDYSVFEFDCPAGLAFDESTEVCVWPGSISACSGSSEIAPSKGAKFTCPDKPGYYADPQNCRFFYACFDLGEHELTAYEFRCPYGLVFDEQKLICEWPYLVPSCGGGTYERHDYGGSGHGGSNHGGYGGANQGGHGGYGGGGQSGYGGYGGGGQGGHGGYGGGGQDGHGEYGGGGQGGHGGYGGGGQDGHGGYGGGGQGGHGGYGGGGQDEHGGYGGGGQGGHGGHGGGGQDGHGGYGGTNQGGHGGYGGGGQDGHGGYGGSNQGGHGGVNQGGHGGYGGTGQAGHGVHEDSNQGGHGGHGGSNQGGHGGHGGSNQDEHGGHGGSNQGEHGGYGGGDQDGHGGHGGSNQGEHGGHGGSHQGEHGGHGGSNQGGHGGYGDGSQDGHGGHGGGDQDGHGGHGGGDQDGHGGFSQGSHGGADQGGHGGSNQGGHGGSNQGGHGGYGGTGQDGHGGFNQGGHGGSNQGGHGGYGGTTQGGYGGSTQGGYGGSTHGGHGGEDQDGHGGYGGSTQGGYGGSTQGGYGGSTQGGHRGVDQVGHGGYGGTTQGGHGGYGGSTQGGHGGVDQDGHGGYGGTTQGGYGGSTQGGHGGVDQGGHGGYGGTTQGGHGGYGGSSQGGHGDADQDGHGGLNQGGYGGSNHGGYGGTTLGGHEGSTQGGHDGHGGHGGSNYGGTTPSGYGGTTQSGHGGSTHIQHGSYGGTTQGGHGGSTHIQHGDSSESGHTGSYTSQGGYTESDYGAGGVKGSYTTSSSLDGYTNIQSKYPTTSHIGYSPAPGVEIFTNAGGYPGQSSTTVGSTGHQTSAINSGHTTIDTGVHTGIHSGAYDGHTPTIQYGGHTRPAVTYEIEETTSHGGSVAIGNTGTTYHGNFGSTESQGSYGSSSYIDGGSGISAGIKTGSHGGSQGANSAGSTIYHGNFGSSGYTVGGSTGSISSGAATHGVIGTGDSTSGTVYAQGDVSGTVLSGNSEQGAITAGINQPGYVHTQSGTPGYVITNGIKTVYDGSSTKGTFDQGIHGHGAIITGEPTSGVVLGGNSSPGTYLAGQTSPGVIIGGEVTPGVSIGHSTGGNYYTGGSGASIYNGATGSRGHTSFTSASKTPKNPFLIQTPPEVVVTGDATSGTSFGSTGGVHYPETLGTSAHNAATGSRGQTTFTSASSSPNFPKNPFTSVTGDSGYKTNEYHDNGGRGTIRYNNGEITHKFTEDDVRDHRTQFGTNPTFDVGSYEASTANQGSFTKTGPTKTGIVTAQVGGSGTYVAGSTRPRPFSSSQNIGANAFGSASSKTSNDLPYGTSTVAPDLSYTTQQTDYDTGSIDVSKINLGSTSGESSSGYSYTKPAVQLNTFGVTGSTKSPILSGQQTAGYPTSPAPFLDVHVYNSPSVVTSAPITASPAVVNTYTYNKPTSVQYKQTGYQSPSSQSSSGAATGGTYSRPVVTEVRKFPSVSSTVSPIGYTTGPLENFKTTAFGAAGIPATISTVQPVIDTGYKTVVSPTPFTVGGNTHGFGYATDSVSTNGNSALDINVSLQQPDFSTHGQYDNGVTLAPTVIGSSGYSTSKSRRPSITQSVTYKRPTVQQVTYESTGSSDYSESNDYNDYSHTQTGGTFGQRVSQGVSVTPSVNYATPTVVIPPEIYNVPSSTKSPAIGVTYREPFQIEKSTARPSQPREPFNGYSYSKPSVKFVSSTTPSISYKQDDSYDSKSTKSGGSPTNPDISRTQVEKLVTNYDRGSAKYTPSGYETYSDNTANRYDEISSNTNRYSGQQSYSSTKTSSAGKSQSGGYSVYSTTPSYELNTDTQNFGGRVEGTSGYGVFNSNLNTNKEAVTSTTYLPPSSPSPGRRVTSSSPRPSIYSVTTPAVTTYSGSYNRGPSTPSYEISTGIGKPKGKGKVIVKFSDLHPLLLGKLGAECTCKADPFASFRGSKPLPINSSKGKVDLRNYDESDVYVDLEASQENGDYDSGDYNTYLVDPTPPNYNDGKYETPVVAVFDGVTPSTKALKSRRPSNYVSGSSTRPPTSTYLPAASSTRRPSSSTYLPPSSTYLPSATLSNRGGVRASFPNNDGSVSASFTSARGGGFRVGKKLGDSSDATGNSLPGQGAAFDRYGPGGLRGVDETLQGTSDCARPGLFRHPNFCNKFYACHWDEWKKKFTLHVFNCPVHLTFDGTAGACNWPSKGPACQGDNLLV